MYTLSHYLAQTSKVLQYTCTWIRVANVVQLPLFMCTSVPHFFHPCYISSSWNDTPRCSLSRGYQEVRVCYLLHNTSTCAVCLYDQNDENTCTITWLYSIHVGPKWWKYYTYAVFLYDQYDESTCTWLYSIHVWPND